MTSHLSTVVTAIKDAGNPFVRLITTATSDVATLGVPYFQSEQIKEAAFQSQNACETIHKALVARLESTNDIVIRKVLEICKLLLLEGPNPQFQTLMFQQTAGKIYNLANLHKTEPDRHISKDSVLEGNINLASAIHKCITGDRSALASYGIGQQSRSATGSNVGGGSGGNFKSDFQAQQEREQKNFKKRREEERARLAGVVTTEKMSEQFDSTLTPAKLVDYAVNHAKKKFSDEELENFVEAAEENGKVEEISAALDKVLRDGKSSLQNRYKVLTIVDVMMRNLPHALNYFRSNNAGIYRHLGIEAGDNPTKSVMTQQLSASLMEIVHGKVKVPAARGASEEAAQPSASAAPANPATTFTYSTPSAAYGAPAAAAPQQQAPPQATTTRQTKASVALTTTNAAAPTNQPQGGQQQQILEMMRKMQEMQAQIQAGTSQQSASQAPSPSVATAGWGNSNGVTSPYNASTTNNGWGEATSTQSVWGSATSLGGWGGNGSASPSVSSQLPPSQPPARRDILDDLFDASVPAPNNTGFGGGSNNNNNNNNSHHHHHQAGPEELTSVATVLTSANDFASPKEADLPQRPNNSVNLTGSFIAGLQLQQSQSQQSQLQEDADEEYVAPKQAVFSQQGSQYGQQLTPTTSFAVSPHPEYIAPAGASKEVTEANVAMLQMKQMQEKMAQMMAAMQQQQQQQQGIGPAGSSNVSAAWGAAVATPATANIISPVTYTDPNAGFPAPAQSKPSRRPEILRLMTKLEEQMGATREVLQRQQVHMRTLEAALAAEH